MDTFFQFSLVIAITTIVLSLLYQILKTSSITTNLPPGKTGLPIIGQTTEFISYPEKFISDRMKKYCDEIFQTSLAGEKMAIFCGPAGNKFIFSSDSKLVKSWLPRSIADALSHPITNCDSPSRKLSDEISSKFLKLESVQQFVPLMDSMVREHLDVYWSPFKLVKVHPLAKDFTFALSCRLFLNYDNSIIDQVKELAKPFFMLTEGIFSVPVNIPGMPFYKAMKGSKLVQVKLLNIIRQRKSELSHKSSTTTNNNNVDDFLGRLIKGHDEEGQSVSDEDIVSKIIGLMFASFYTTSTSIAFAIGYLAQHSDVYDKVLQEQLEIRESKKEGELLNWADILKMKYTWNVVCETMRLRPPAHGSFREVIKDFTYETYNIPKGFKVYWTVHSTHKNPKYFPNPEEFNPSRFEGSGQPPYTFVPFGGGPRMCAGKEYARIETLAFLYNVVTTFKFNKHNPYEKVIYNPDPIPTEGIQINLFPHAK